METSRNDFLNGMVLENKEISLLTFEAVSFLLTAISRQADCPKVVRGSPREASLFLGKQDEFDFFIKEGWSKVQESILN